MALLAHRGTRPTHLGPRLNGKLKLPACATGTHQDPPPSVPVPHGSPEEFERYLTLSDATTLPAAAELSRRETERNAPL